MSLDRVARVFEHRSFRERYDVLDRIGSGSFAQVYRAVQRSTGQDVAVKILTLDDRPDADPIQLQIARFRREVQLCAYLRHPNIVRLMDSGQPSPDVIYAIFEYVPGWNLADVLAIEGPLSPASAVHLMCQMLDALACAHARGIVHRDVKPENVLVTETGARRNAMILDFGMAVIAEATARWASRLTLRGQLQGTLAYSAPEQLRGEDATPAADIYAWALTSIEMLTGKLVMAGATIHETLDRQLGPEPVPIPPELLSTDLGATLRDACAKDVSQRSASAADLLARLLHLSDPLPERFASQPSGGREPARGRHPSPLERPRIFAVPLLRNPNFTGREELLVAIEEKLRGGPLLAVCALKGLGGVGKTQLALEYAHRYADRYKLVAWIRAEDGGTLDADFAQLATTLRLPESDAPEVRRKVQAARQWFERNDRWLLVLDNAPDPRAIRTYLPANPLGHVLVTSRNQSWHGLARSLSVDVLSRAESVELLLKRSGSHDRSSAGDLAQILGDLPLALEEAAAYVDATGRSLADYLALFRHHHAELMAQSAPRADYPMTLRATWELSFERLQAEEPDAVTLLNTLAHLAPENIPRSLLLPRGPAEEIAGGELALDRCLAALRRYSFVTVDGDTVSVHRLLQTVTRDRMTQDERDAAAERALRQVDAVFPRSGALGHTRLECARLLPHAIATLGYAGQREATRICVADLLSRTGRYLSASGLIDEAVKHLERSISIYQMAGPSLEHELARAADNLGMVRYQEGELERAAAAHQRAIDIFARDPGLASRTSQALTNLAWIRWSEGQRASAEEASHRAVGLADASAREADPRAVASRAILGRVLYERGDVPGARTALEEASRLASVLPRAYLPLLSGSLMHLAQLLLYLGRPEDARAWAEEAVKSGDTAYGPHHPLVHAARCVLGQAYQMLGDDEAATLQLTEVVTDAKSFVSHMDQVVAIALAYLAQTRLDLGQLEEARTQLEEFEYFRPRVCGTRRHFEAQIHLARGRLALVTGEPDAAFGECKQSDAILEEDLGSRHPARVSSWCLLGDVHLLRRDLGGAMASYDGALGFAAANGIEDHPMLAAVHLGKSAVHDRLGERPEAQAETTRARHLLDTALISPHAHPGRIFTRRRETLLRLGG
jgi:tetratricopeptide (TPR) repeat protein